MLAIVTWCSEHAKLFEDDFELERVPKNPYRHIKQRKLRSPMESKLKSKSSDSDV